MRTAPLAVLAAVLATALPACGEDEGAERFSGQRREVAKAVERLGEAARRGDTARICATLLARSVTRRLGQRCPARIVPALRAVNDPRLEVVAVRLRRRSATATVVAGTDDPPRSGDVELVLEGGRWRVAGVGPLPPR